MEATGKYHSATRTLNGNVLITFQIDENGFNLAETINSLSKVEKLDIKAIKHRDKRSLNANAYFWQLCDKIAKALNSDKDTIYLLQLSKYGVFADVDVIKDALPILAQTYRHIETRYTDGEFVEVRCYVGSSNYDTKQMSDLINGTVEDAKELGVDTMTKDDIEAMLSVWRAYG